MHSLHVAISFVLYLPDSCVLQFQESPLMTEVISVVNLLRNFMYLSAEVKVCIVTLASFPLRNNACAQRKDDPSRIFEHSAKVKRLYSYLVLAYTVL